MCWMTTAMLWKRITTMMRWTMFLYETVTQEEDIFYYLGDALIASPTKEFSE